jgi:hypothetical protein
MVHYRQNHLYGLLIQILWSRIKVLLTGEENRYRPTRQYREQEIEMLKLAAAQNK